VPPMPGDTRSRRFGTDVRILPDVTALARTAADEAAAVIRQAVARRGMAHAMFATGNSQLAFIDALVSDTDGVPWGDVVVFHMDEYVGMGPEHPASFQRWIRHRIVELARPRAAHYLDGLADPEAECRRYAALLQRFPLDLCCLGIGENGHLAFNDPPADFDTQEPYLAVDLDEACRRQQLGEGWFPTLESVPRKAISMSIKQIVKSERIVCTVPDRRKAPAVRGAVEGPVTNRLPASILQTHPACDLFLDAPAASLLQGRG
jgi:glucosamine-6-phosphate deaminase